MAMTRCMMSFSNRKVTAPAHICVQGLFNVLSRRVTEMIFGIYSISGDLLLITASSHMVRQRVVKNNRPTGAEEGI